MRYALETKSRAFPSSVPINEYRAVREWSVPRDEIARPKENGEISQNKIADEIWFSLCPQLHNNGVELKALERRTAASSPPPPPHHPLHPLGTFETSTTYDFYGPSTLAAHCTLGLCNS